MAVYILASAGTAWAQCSDPSTHFRGGLWKQWILQITPGAQAQGAIQRVITEVNAARPGHSRSWSSIQKSRW